MSSLANNAAAAASCKRKDISCHDDDLDTKKLSSSEGSAFELNSLSDFDTTSSTSTSNGTVKTNGSWKFSIPSKAIYLTHSSSVHQERSTNENNININIGTNASFQGWEFTSTKTSWSLSSRNILTVTYSPACQSIPAYTNKSVGVEYMQRACKLARCRKGNCFQSKRFYRETFDAKDIRHVEFLENVKVRGMEKGHSSFCGVQLHLKNKREGFDGKRFHDETKTVGGDTGTHKFKTTMNDVNEHITTEEHGVPLDGSTVLEKNGYVQKDMNGMEDDIPLPPWRHTVGQNNSVEVYGPIVTFLMPRSSQEMKDEGINSNSNQQRSRAPPLLWKVQFPPDPSIAVEAFTVLDGNLDVRSRSSGGEVSDYGSVNLNTDGYLSRGQSLLSTPSYSDDDSIAYYPTNIYINGYQSWSFTGSVTRGDKQPTPAMPNIVSGSFDYGAAIPPVGEEVETDYYEDAYETGGYQSKPGCYGDLGAEEEDIDGFEHLTHYKSDFYTCVSCSEPEGWNGRRKESDPSKHILDEDGGTALVLGYLSQRYQYGLITLDSDLRRVAMHASVQGTIASRSKGICTDWAYCQILTGDGYDEEPMADYLNAVSGYNNARPLQTFPPLTGWCSWYHYYQNIDSATLTENFNRLYNLKSMITSDAVIIDDGYMTSWGDWASLKPKCFPATSGGMKTLSDNIRKYDMIPGIWMAPFACDKNSKLAREHPDWIIRNDQGRIANSAWCGKFFYGLDATNPAVREYAFKSIRRAVKDWGYKVLKLDFLYAACLAGNGKYDLSMSRAETMYLAMQTLRAAAGPETFIIGCGCPIGPAIGLVDANRISADTGHTWYPRVWWDHGTLPSLRAMVRNSITRSCAGHRFWHNDPDCILLGDTTRLTEVEVKSAATVIAMTGGMLLLSDDMSKLGTERLRVATRIYPVTGVTGVVLDLHNTSESGIPSIIRLWCTDKPDSNEIVDTTASGNAKRTSFCPGRLWHNPWDRKRTCLPVAKGLGTWSIVSLSNWLDIPSVVSIPPAAYLPPKHANESKDFHLGYHLFSFWTSKYTWVPANQNGETIKKMLGPHESEILHVKPVSLDRCQYIGSDLHFTCGNEVVAFDSTSTSIDLQLRKDSKRSGFVYLFLPFYAEPTTVTMSGMKAQGEFVFRTPVIGHNNSFYGGQVIRVRVVVNGNGTEDDGRVALQA